MQKYPQFPLETGGISFNSFPQVAGGFAFLPYAATLCGTQRTENRRYKIVFRLLPLDGSGIAVPSFQLHSVFGTASSQVPSNDAASRFIGFEDKSRDGFKNPFQLRALSFCFCPKRPGGPPLEARFTAPAYARDHLDEVGVAKEHRLFEVSVAAFQSVALQEMLLKLKFSFTFGSIITPRRKRSQEPISKDIGQNVCVSVGRCLQEESPAPSRPA